MLRIGSHTYDLVRGQSGFYLSLDSPYHRQARQSWRLDVHYVPSDQHPGREDDRWEYLRLTMHPFIFQVRDWRGLTGFRHEGSDPEDLNPVLNHTVIENLLAREFQIHDEIYDVRPDSLTVKRAGGFLFTVELTGAVIHPDRQEDLHLLDEIPFAEVMLCVPLNAADPVATARATVARAIGLTETGNARITRHDWRREKDPQAPLDTSHQVVLPTPWRKTFA